MVSLLSVSIKISSHIEGLDARVTDPASIARAETQPAIGWNRGRIDVRIRTKPRGKWRLYRMMSQLRVLSKPARNREIPRLLTLVDTFPRDIPARDPRHSCRSKTARTDMPPGRLPSDDPRRSRVGICVWQLGPRSKAEKLTHLLSDYHSSSASNLQICIVSDRPLKNGRSKFSILQVAAGNEELDHE